VRMDPCSGQRRLLGFGNMSGILPANQTARRREERLLIQARLDAIDAKLNTLVVEVGATAPAFPTDLDIEEVGKLLVEGRIRLPSHVKITVTTEVEEIKSKVFGTSTVFTHTADQLCANRLRPMSIQAALKAGLVAKLGGEWLWREDRYRKLVPSDPRLRPLT
jgi:hypothetical protein